MSAGSRSWRGGISCSFAACVRVACDDEEGEAHKVKLEADDGRSFGTTRSYWLHRRRALFTGLLKLLEETGTHCLRHKTLHDSCHYQKVRVQRSVVQASCAPTYASLSGQTPTATETKDHGNRGRQTHVPWPCRYLVFVHSHIKA